MVVQGQRNFVNLNFDGNSITAGQGVTTAQRFSDLIFTDSTLLPYIGSVKSNIAVGGQDTVDMITRQASFLFTKRESRTTRNLVIAMEVRNDLVHGVTNATAYSDMVSYCQNCKNQGFDVLLIIQTPSTGGSDPLGGSPVNRSQAQLETDRLAVRAMFLADFPTATSTPYLYLPNTGITYADLCLDLGDPTTTMGNVANCSNLTYYQDGTHWTVTGHSTEAAYIKTAIQYYLTILR